MRKLSPIESEFATQEEADAHDQWVRAKVDAALNSDRLPIPHDEAMATARAIIDGQRASAAMER